MGQININNYPTVNSLADADLLIVENATHGTGTTTPKQLRENAIGTDPLQTTAQTVTGAINELKGEIDAGAGVVCYDVDSVTQGRLGSYSGDVKYLLIHFETDAEPYNGAYSLVLSHSSGSVAIMQYGALYDSVMGMEYDREIYSGSTLLCEIMDEGKGTEADPVHVDVLGTIDGYVTAGWGRQAALGDRATAEGIGTEASGNYAHAHGYQTTASGDQSTAMGYSTTASADGATAMGNGSRASGVNSIAGGYNTTASGAVSTAIGTNTQATQQAQLATGKYNKTNNDALVMVGNGTGASARSNALEVLLNGDVIAGNDLIDSSGNVLSEVAVIAEVLAEALTKTASGNPVVITDCAGGKARSLITEINAIQDLHGLPFPYVGGAGKNKFDGVYPDISSSTVQYRPIYVGNGTYTISTDCPKNSAEGANIFFLAGNVQAGASTPGNGVWNGRTITVTTDDGYVTVAYRSEGNVDPTNYNTQIESGSQATPFAPYSNICPISGRDSAVVTRSDGDEISEDFTIQLGQTVYGAEINWNTGVMTVRTAAETFDGSDDESWNWSTANSLAWIEVNGAFITDDVTQHNVYTLNNMFEDKSWVDKSNSGSVGLVYGNSRVYVKYSGITSVADAKALFASNPLQVCYELAEPIELTLTPTEVQMLKGYNRVTIESGSIELGYIAKLT
jgi:hypothetical protein